MDRLLDIYELSKLDQEQFNNKKWNSRSNTNTHAYISPTKKSPDPDEFTTKLYKNFSKDLMQILLKLFNDIEREGVWKLVLTESKTRANQKRATAWSL